MSSSIGNLKAHQKAAKYCIKIQLEKKPELKQEDYNCKYCKKDFKLKSSVERHELSCNGIQIVYQEEIIKLKEELKNKDETIVKQEEKIRLKDEKLKDIIKLKDDTIKSKDDQLAELKEK